MRDTLPGTHPRDEEGALTWFEKAARLGNYDALEKMRRDGKRKQQSCGQSKGLIAHLYLTGTGVTEDLSAAQNMVELVQRSLTMLMRSII